MSAPSVPSFSSFPDLQPGPSSRPSISDDTSVARDEKGLKWKSKKNKSEKDRKHRSRDDKWEKPRFAATPVPENGVGWSAERVLEDEKLKEEQDRREKLGVEDVYPPHGGVPLYLSDRRGDPLNVRYGGPHSGDVPKYHLVNRGRKILGLNEAWTVVRRSGKGIEVAVGGRRRLPTLTDASSRALLAAPPVRQLLSSTGKYKYQEINGFLRLPSRRGREDDQAYRSITFSKDDANSDSNSSVSGPEDSDGNDDEEDGPRLTSHQLFLKDLEGQLASDPSSIASWLSLLNHSLSTIPLTSQNATKTRSEITISILSRALSAHPKNATSTILRLKYLKAGEEVWHESKTRSEWQTAWNVGGIGMWIEWLEWRIRKANGGVDGVVEDARRVLSALGDREENEVHKIRVIWRVAVAFQQAGFCERATALFQAQAELTFEVPQSLYGLPLNTQLDALEEFWESEAPRAGEAAATGWAAWVSSAASGHAPELALPPVPPPDPSPLLKDIADPYRAWHTSETLADRTQRVPARSTDLRSETDPYATVLFSDVRALLLPLTSTRAKNAFRMAWLALLGLHIPGFVAAEGAWDDRWAFTHLSSDGYLRVLFPERDARRRLIADSHAGVLIGREREYASCFGPVKEWGMGVFGPLEVLGTEHWSSWTALDVRSVDENFVRRVFKQLRCGTDDWEWDTYALAFEATLNIKNALKLSREFLSSSRNSLPHWAAHAQLERRRGRVDDALKVYRTVVTPSPLSPSQSHIGQLWWDWAETEWLADRPDDALSTIFRSANVDASGGTGGVTILRAKRSLDDVAQSRQERWKDREAWIKLRALLELLTSSSPAAALSVFDSQDAGSVVQEGSEGAVRESLMVASLLMLYHHSVALRRPTPPALLRQRVHLAIEAFPSNTLILGMFLEAEKGQGVWGRVRTLLGQNTVDNGAVDKNVVRRVAEVWVLGWEKGRWEEEAERTRNGLITALESERIRGSPVIWRIMLEFEIRMGQLQRAKTMLYRAIGECPLTKDFYLMAFGSLRAMFEPHELNAFADTMAERGLRMRKDLGEFLDQASAERARDESAESDSEDEIEHEARERRRLMPY